MNKIPTNKIIILKFKKIKIKSFKSWVFYFLIKQLGILLKKTKARIYYVKYWIESKFIKELNVKLNTAYYVIFDIIMNFFM